jgi:transcriptional regulator with XRE-family HTH domain
MVKNTSIAHRILQLVAAAPSRRAFARYIGSTDVTVMGWEAGSLPYERSLRQIAEKTGVSLAWLKDGRGDDEKELQKFRDRLQSYDADVTSSVVREEPQIDNMECPLHLPPPTSGTEIALEHAATHLDSAGLAGLIQSTLRDDRLGKEERFRSAKRLTALLAHKLTHEAPPHKPSKS